MKSVISFWSLEPRNFLINLKNILIDFPIWTPHCSHHIQLEIKSTQGLNIKLSR